MKGLDSDAAVAGSIASGTLSVHFLALSLSPLPAYPFLHSRGQSHAPHVSSAPSAHSWKQICCFCSRASSNRLTVRGRRSCLRRSGAFSPSPPYFDSFANPTSASGSPPCTQVPSYIPTTTSPHHIKVSALSSGDGAGKEEKGERRSFSCFG
jgi:hypothetical protein